MNFPPRCFPRRQLHLVRDGRIRPRSVDTVANFAAKKNLEIHTVDGFRERKGDSAVTRRNAELFKDNTELFSFLERQWADFNFTLSDGERLAEVQERNINALNEILIEHKDKTVAIGTHGVALSTIINFYDRTYGFKDFLLMADIMPWVVKMIFDVSNCVEIEKIDLFAQC